MDAAHCVPFATIWGELYENIDDAHKDAILTAGIDKWVFLENIVRFVYDYEGCVVGEQGCDERSPALCLYCAEFQQREVRSETARVRNL